MLAFALLSRARGGGRAARQPQGHPAHAAAWAEDEQGDVVALVDRDGGLWTGRRKLSRLGAVSFVPDRLLYGDRLVLVRSEQAGLTGHAAWAVLRPDGAGAIKGERDAPVREVRATPTGAVLLFPDAVVVVDQDRRESKEIPLPFLHPRDLRVEGGVARVRGPDGRGLTLALTDGCPTDLPAVAPEDALDAVMWREAARVCGAPPRLDDAVIRRARAQRDAAVEEALAAGDADAIIALDPPGGVEGLRPSGKGQLGAVRTREEATVRVAERLLPDAGLVVVHTKPTPGMDLGPWAGTPWAPACVARLVLAPGTLEEAAVLEDRIAAAGARGLACADGLAVAHPGEVSEWKDAVFYVEAGTRVRGGRNGALSPHRVRMDLAWLTGAADPLHTIAAAPELVPEWTVGPGPGFGPILDVDGSWVAGAGWDVVRGPASAQRVDRASLGGPVSGLRVRRDGRMEVVSGGQHALATLETGAVTWVDAPSDSADVYAIQRPRRGPRPAVDPGPWRVVGASTLQGSAKANGKVVELPVAVRDVENRDSGTVVHTDLGLIGLDAEGTITWRLTDPLDWVLVEDRIVGTTPFGVHGWRLPY